MENPNYDIHNALKVINESSLTTDEKHQCRHFLKRNRNEAPFIIDAKNRSANDETVLSDFLRQMTIEDTQRHEMNAGKSTYAGTGDYNYGDNYKTTTESIDQRPDLRRGTSMNEPYQQPQQHEVNIFKNDNELNPLMTFEPGVDWTVVKHNLKLHYGWLKKKGDPNNRRVKAPFQGGDYSLIDMVPESKVIRIFYSSLFSFWDSEQKVKLKYGDTQDEVRKRIQHAFKFERRHFSLYHLREKGTKNYVDMDFDELDDSKQYELVIPWLAKLQRHTKDESSTSSTSTDPKANKTTDTTTKTNHPVTSNKGTSTTNNNTTKVNDNIQTTPTSSSLQQQPQLYPSTSQSTGINDKPIYSNNNPINENPTYDPSSTLRNTTF